MTNDSVLDSAPASGPSPLDATITHGWRKVTIGAFTTAAIWALLVAPGWDVAHREATLPVASEDLIALGFSDFSGTGNVSISLVAQSLAQSQDVTIKVSASIRQKDELATRPVLLVSGAMARTVRCTGAGVHYNKGVRIDPLSSAAKAAALAHANTQLSIRKTDGGGWTQPSETEVLEAAAKLVYTEVAFETDSRHWDETNVDPATGKEEVSTVWRRQISTECTFEGTAIWTARSPDYQLHVPATFLVMPTSLADDFSLATTTSVPSMSGLTLTQATYSSSADAEGGISWSQSGTKKNNPFSESQRNNYQVYSRRSIGAVFRSSTEAQREQASLFNSGVGLGVAASTIVWMWPIVYDLVFIHHPARRRQGKRHTASTETK